MTKFLRPRWLDNGLLLFCAFMGLDSFMVCCKHARKELTCVAVFACGDIEQLSGRAKERACVMQGVRGCREGGRGGEERSRPLPSPPPAPYFSHSLAGSFPFALKLLRKCLLRRLKKNLANILRSDNNPYIFTSEAWLKNYV